MAKHGKGRGEAMKEPLRNWSRLRSWCLLSEDAAGEVSVAVEDDGKGWDSVEVLGPDIMMEVMKLLDAHRVACSIVVSRGWYHVATIDRLWNPGGERKGANGGKTKGTNGEQETSFNCLRQGKVIPTSTPTLCEELWKGTAHVPCLLMVRITKEDLCDHAWGFHFNEVLSKYPAVCSQYNSAPDAEKGGTVPFFPVF
ncbi:hypothetical protein HPP92_022374 [Vanilla planifolia]|uniref:F-box domain-containing protein n=1 Tax=Vanilla planifolia TaxID=51239 RepID=A0A835PS29_VANPL|nr:hypothetical protein HPP92_022374 [Vanilla planifolia]